MDTNDVKKLSEEESAKYSAGQGIAKVVTVMICSNARCNGAKGWIRWEGDYVGKGPFNCDFCKQSTLYGNHIE